MGFLFLILWLAALKEYEGRKLWLLLWFATMALPFFGGMDAFRRWPSTAAMLVMIARENPGGGLVARLPAVAAALIGLFALHEDFPDP